MAGKLEREALDAQQFARVWKRVVTNGEASMVELNVKKEDAGTPVPLGEAAQASGGFLQQRVQVELRRWRSFQRLAAQAGQNRMLLDLAAQSYRSARRLAAALFLITGGWYLPERQSRAQRWPDVRSGLRGLFRSSQKWEAEYRRAAETCSDVVLSELFMEQCHACQKQQMQIRQLLERL